MSWDHAPRSNQPSPPGVNWTVKDHRSRSVKLTLPRGQNCPFWPQWQSDFSSTKIQSPFCQPVPLRRASAHLRCGVTLGTGPSEPPCHLWFPVRSAGKAKLQKMLSKGWKEKCSRNAGQVRISTGSFLILSLSLDVWKKIIVMKGLAGPPSLDEE